MFSTLYHYHISILNNKKPGPDILGLKNLVILNVMHFKPIVVLLSQCPAIVEVFYVGNNFLYKKFASNF